MKNQSRIIEVPFGIANRYGKEIEIHKDLKSYPKLYEAVLDHELEHSNSPGLTKHDFIHDLELIGEGSFWDKISISLGLLGFMLTHPSSLVQLLPLWYHQKRKVVVYDLNTTITWIMIIALIAILTVVRRLIF